MVDLDEINLRKELVDRIVICDRLIPRQKSPRISLAVDEGVDGITVCADCGDNNLTMTIIALQGLRGSDRDCSMIDRSFPNRLDITVDLECDVLDAVTVLGQMVVYFLQHGVFVLGDIVNLAHSRRSTDGGRKDEGGLAVGHDVGSHAARARLGPAVGDMSESHPRDIVGGGLLRVAHVPSDVVESDIFRAQLRRGDTLLVLLDRKSVV